MDIGHNGEKCGLKLQEDGSKEGGTGIEKGLKEFLFDMSDFL